MEETIFYILGGALVVIAVALSALGLRLESFPPSRPIMLAITAGIVTLVGATATFAWVNAEDEQSEHAAEHAEERAAAAEEAAAELIAAQGGAEEGPVEDQSGDEADVAEEAPADEGAAAADGAPVFESAGCSGCHTLSAAGSTAQTGPDLDGALKGKPPSYIETSIVDPNAEIAEGFPPNVMPQTYGEDLAPDDLAALVAYLSESTSGK